MSNVEIKPNSDYILAWDISASMQTSDSKTGGLSRYQYQLEKSKQFLAEATKYDPDGVDVILFGMGVQTFQNITPADVDAKLGKVNFEPATQTHLAIQAAYDLHKAKKAQDPSTQSVLFLFTDGEPSDQKAVESTIKNISNSLERDEEFSIGVLTVGEITPGLQNWLTKLDDDLKGAKYDIVDVKALDEVSFIEAVVGAVND